MAHHKAKKRKKGLLAVLLFGTVAAATIVIRLGASDNKG